MRTTKAVLATAAALLLVSAAACSSSDGDDDATKASPTTEASSDEGSSSDEAASDDAASGDDASTDATLPESWPDEVALPDDTTLLEAYEVSETSWMIIAQIDGDTEATYDALLAQLTDAGYEIVASTFTDSDEGGFGSISASGDDYTVAVSFGPDPTGDTSQVTISVAAAT